MESAINVVPKKANISPGELLEIDAFRSATPSPASDFDSLYFPRMKTAPINASTMPVINDNCRVQIRDSSKALAWR